MHVRRIYSRRNKKLRGMGAKSYADYLLSKEWAEIRDRVMARDDRTCQCCGRLATQVHHTKYTRANLSGRTINSLFAICNWCHKYIEFEQDGTKTHQTRCRKKAFYLRTINKTPESSCPALRRHKNER